MNLHTRLSTVRASSDRGFSLIEVVVAILIFAIVATAALSFAIRANTASAYQQHNQVAVTLASQAMERVIATQPNLNVMVDDRSQARVTAAWTAMAAKAGVSSTYLAWDGTANAASVAVVPITSEATLSGTKYLTTTLIGGCYRPRSTQTNLTNVRCEKIPGAATAPTVTPSGYVAQVRAIVVVSWTADNECPAGCSYQTSSIIDVNGDLEWLG